MKPVDINQVIGGKRYNTETATVIASDAWDVHNVERHGRNTYLYRTAKGAYFATHLTVEPLTQDAAVALWEYMPEHERDFEEAFPGVTIEEA